MFRILLLLLLGLATHYRESFEGVGSTIKSKETKAIVVAKLVLVLVLVSRLTIVSHEAKKKQQ